MISAEQLNILIEVAPFAGAWIEMNVSPRSRGCYSSLPSRERGLKFIGGFGQYLEEESLPSRERGLK